MRQMLWRDGSFWRSVHWKGVVRSLLIGLCPMVAFVQAQTLRWLAPLPGHESSWAYGISADGSTVVGFSWDADPPGALMRAVRWTSVNGWQPQDLGSLAGPGRNSRAKGASANGQVIVGDSAGTSGYMFRAFRWTSGTGMQDLGSLGGAGDSWGEAVSANGSVVVGAATIDGGGYHAFRWTASSGMQDLGTLGGRTSWAYGISADGSIIVGWAENASGQTRAFRWTALTGMQDLGVLPGGSYSSAWGISANGQVVVGTVNNAEGKYRACRWTASTGLQELGILPGFDDSDAFAASGDGAVIGGKVRIRATNSWRAVRWTAQTGMRNLNRIYADLLANGSILYSVFGVSQDGRYLVGVGYNASTGREEAFLLEDARLCPPPDPDVDGNGCVDDADLLQVLFAFGQSSTPLDINCDGTVDDADLLLVLFNFGSGC
ncbi:hypothetical protein HRbin15_00703 [bacterium HR15]|nr:hypothetical protein HRbin15_00703 [bacterium HR15]